MATLLQPLHVKDVGWFRTACEGARARRLPLMLVVTAVMLGLDAVTKFVAETTLAKLPGQSVDVFGGFLELTLIHNSAAAFGVLHNPMMRSVATGAVVALLAFGYYRRLPRGNRFPMACLGLQLGGALGNLLDRFQHLRVTDFIGIGDGDPLWSGYIVCNVADLSVLAGIFCMAAYLVVHRALTRQKSCASLALG